MVTTPQPLPPRLLAAGQALRQVLLRLDVYAKAQMVRVNAHPAAAWAPAAAAHVRDLDVLIAAVQAYDQAATESLPPALDWRDNPCPTPAELLAEREADPAYRLGWARGLNYALSKGATPPFPARGPLPAHVPASLEYIKHYAARLHAARTGTDPVAGPAYARTEHGTL